MSYFIYNPLNKDEIRVLRLLPGEQDDALQGRLETHQLPPALGSTPPPPDGGPAASGFDALSYVWGGEVRPEDGCSIAIDGQTELGITPSLDSFLRRLRRPSDDRILWADAVCINQQDTKEREQQVALMPRVYSSADSVLVDLGEESEDSDLALEIMDAAWKKHIWAGAKFSGKDMSLEESVLLFGLGNIIKPDDSSAADRRHVLEAAGELPPRGDAKWHSVARFFSRPWFARVWVIQEFILARNPVMHLGTRTLNWRELWAPICQYADGQPLAAVPRTFESQRGVLSYFSLGVSRRLRELRTTPGGEQLILKYIPGNVDGHKLCDWLLLFQLSQCTRRRDRYFALLGLASDVAAASGAAEADLAIDYTSPIETIVVRMGRFLLSHGPDSLLMSGLSQQDSSGHLKPGTPSWVRDYTQVGRYFRGQSVLKYPHKAAGNTGFYVRPSPWRMDTIVVAGMRVDTVDTAAFASPLREFSRTRDMKHYSFDRLRRRFSLGMRAMLGGSGDQVLMDGGRYRPTGESLFDAAAKTWSHDQTEDDGLMGFHFLSWTAALGDVNKMMEAFDQAYEMTAKRFGQKSRDSVNEAMSAFNSLVFDADGFRVQPTRTRRGYFASLPDCYLPGDEIWCVVGVPMPLLLRKSDAYTEGHLYKLVGPCYVHGIMNGEVLERRASELYFLPIH